MLENEVVFLEVPILEVAPASPRISTSKIFFQNLTKFLLNSQLPGDIKSNLHNVVDQEEIFSFCTHLSLIILE